ncbi:hypothetical protein EGH22_02370 [Halomicroarcula sp. F28]|uniref:hypothetical protein n=1 Tax=Haloarcula salinisoli TaxID=2487746 RepID=UPI001C72CE55|nr:hypothetical protein [Halomicroarcula salinisoli]MBX0285158.1 hypothetical protein [Halomicroarcula salinisoli]
MPQLSRRRIIRLAGVASAGGLTGCSALSDSGPDPYQFVSISATNDTQQPRTFHFVVLEDDELVYGVSPTVPASEAGTVESIELEGYPTERRVYDFYVRLDSDANDEWQQFPAETISETCLDLSINVEALPDSTGAEVRMRKDIDPDGCEPSPTS